MNKYFKGQIVHLSVLSRNDDYMSFNSVIDGNIDESIVQPLDLTDPNVIASLAPEKATHIVCDVTGTWYAYKRQLHKPGRAVKDGYYSDFNRIKPWSFITGIAPTDWTKEIYQIVRGENGGVFRVEIKE